MRIHEVRALSQEDLLKELESARRELMNLRFRLAMRQLDNSSEFRKVRRNIARLQTVLRERELVGS
ncbi:MAG: 50S ribosomal protein L29 [Dehalococcoidia bacterium]